MIVEAVKRWTIVGLALGVAWLLPTGCGGASATATSADLSGTAQGMKVGLANLALARYCVSGRDYGRAVEGVEDLIRIYRESPDAIYSGGTEPRTLTQVLADAASTAEECGEQQLATRLDRAREG